MNNVAVIVETRPMKRLPQIIAEHARFLPGWRVVHFGTASVTVNTRRDYNILMTSEGFWADFISYDRVLIFQHDSKLLRHGIDEFLFWDYIGAPWKKNVWHAHPLRIGGNGGLSLRNPRACLEAVIEKPYEPDGMGEDAYFVHTLHELGWLVAPHSACKQFACESQFVLGTLGLHKVRSYLTGSQVYMLENQYAE